MCQKQKHNHRLTTLKNQTLRIISGKWRSRKITFPANIPHLRPTSDRIRENLFNWLQSKIQQTTCLDLFAGSGALGFEALSRGARSCTFVESHPKAQTAIQKLLKELDITQGSLVKTDAFKFLALNKKSYHLIFLDPPFGQNFLPKILTSLIEGNCIHQESLIYIEVESNFNLNTISNDWKILKIKKAGDVQYGLLQLKENIKK